MTIKSNRAINSRITKCIIVALLLCVFSPLVFPGSVRADGAPVVVDLSDDGIKADAPGIYSDGSILTITLPGEYLLRGSLSNGQIIVDCEVEGKVRLFFSGITVHCENAPALYIKKCSPRLTIDLAEGTVNELSDGAEYADKESKIDAVIFSKSDLTITGTGVLNVTGAYRDGIVSKDDLRIKSGTINVNAVHNGVIGKDCVEIYGGEIKVHAGNDGIKTTNDDTDRGYILVEGGTVSILCGDDPLSFVRGISLTVGTVDAAIDPSLKAAED